MMVILEGGNIHSSTGFKCNVWW